MEGEHCRPHGAAPGLASAGIGLKTERGREIARKLAQRSDVVMENFRPGYLESIFVRLMEAIGCPGLAKDPRLAHDDGRAAHIEEIDAAISAWTGSPTSAEVLRALEAAEVPCAKDFSAADIHADPHYRARSMIESHVLPDGQHTVEVRTDLGYDAAALREEGVV